MRPSSHPARTRSARARARPVAVMVAVVAVAASSCSLLPFGPGTGASTQQLADGSTFLVAAPANGGDDAIVSGRLALIGGNCIGLDSPGSDETAVLAFPHGTRPSDDGEAIVLPDGLRITLGQSIWGGGGYGTLDIATDAFASWPDAPDGCAKATYLAGIREVSTSTPPQG